MAFFIQLLGSSFWRRRILDFAGSQEKRSALERVGKYMQKYIGFLQNRCKIGLWTRKKLSFPDKVDRLIAIYLGEHTYHFEGLDVLPVSEFLQSLYQQKIF